VDAAETHPDWTREVAALRRVARALLADEHAADDVLQETWLRTHARTPGLREPVGYWKRAVANLVRDRRRGEARRAQRERDVARPEALPSTDEVAARLELAQRVARAAAELPEPYRSTIHLHYFEDLGAQEIAARAGVPLETVRTRIRRGLERMRAELDASTDGDRSAWCLVLAPLALPRASEPALATGAALATTAGGVLAVSKTWIAAAGVLAAVATLWFAMRGAPTAPPSAPMPPVAEASGPEGATDRMAEARAPEAVDGVRLALAAAAAPPAPVDGLLDLVGSIALLDGSGVQRNDVDGFFFIVRTAADGRTEELPVQFEAGRWSARAALGESLTFHHAYAAGHPARLPGEPVAVPADGHVRLEAVSWPRTHLRVIDAASGLDLDHVELRWSTFGTMPVADRHPGDAGEHQVRIDGLSSPFEVELPGPMSEIEPVRLWVSAPELAWEHVDVMLSSGGTRTVGLSYGGDLEVLPRGPSPEHPWRIALVEYSGEPRQSEQYVAFQHPAAGPVTRLDRLAPGTYSVLAQRIDFQGGALGVSEEFEVRAGEVTRVSLPLELPEAGPRVHLSGTLTWPEGTPVGDLVIRPVSRTLPQESVSLHLPDMQPDADRPRTMHWDAGELVAGEYLAINDGAGLRRRFDTGAGPEQRLDLELPPHVALVVRVIDDGDGHPLPEAKVSWTLRRIDDGGYEMWTEESDPAELGFLRFEVPAVPLVLDVSAPGWTSQRQDVTPQTDATNELEFRLHRESGLRVRFLEGDAVIPRLFARPQILDLTGERVSPFGLDWDHSACMVLLDPGDYRVSFVELGPDWLPPDSVEVRVVEGALTPVDFPLERAP
jgi:RNA polymerase sigma-70 factor (ECF subfamily)